MNSDNLDQFVTIRAPNSGRIYIDSQDEGINNNIEISAVGSNQLINNIRRIAVAEFGMFNNIFNVNRTNRSVLLELEDFPGTIHVIVVHSGFYKNSVQLMDAFIFATDNTTVPPLPPGYGFDYDQGVLSFAPDPPVFPEEVLSQDSTRYRLVCTSSFPTYTRTGYRFVGGNMLEFGKQLINLPDNLEFNPEKIVGSVGLMYTRFIDIRSNVITDYQKNANANNGFSGSNLIYRYYLQDSGCNETSRDTVINPTVIDLDVTTIDCGWQGLQVQNLNWLNYDNSRNVQTIDIGLYDQFGRALWTFSNPYQQNDFGGFLFNITLMTES